MSEKISRRKLLIGAGAGSVLLGTSGYFVYKKSTGVSDYDGNVDGDSKPDMSHMDVPDKPGKGDPDPQDMLDSSNIDVEKVKWPKGNKKPIYEEASKLDDLNSIIPGTKDK